jgi:ABC-2 type transport system ATP-binding protein
MIHVRDLRVDYDDVCAVRDVSLEIGSGEVYGLVGPNGAGKTTTLRSLVGLLEPTYGEIFLNGIDLSTHREEAVRLVGFMPDYAPIYEDLTVWEFLDLFAASYMIPASARSDAIDKHLELVDLTEKRNAMTNSLSRGMRQRLIIAKTLMPEPRIILLDEPAAWLDPYGRALLKNTLRRLGAEGKTVLISSHVLAEMSEFCTSVGIMEKGRMVVTGRVDEVASQVLGRMEAWVEPLSGEARCEHVLAAHASVRSIRREDAAFVFAFDGDQDELSDLLTALVTAGVRVASFGRKKEDLEEVFLKVGAREVS